MGVVIKGDIGFDFGKMMERKTKVVSTLRGGVQTLLKSNHVRSVVGTGKLIFVTLMPSRRARWSQVVSMRP